MTAQRKRRHIRLAHRRGGFIPTFEMDSFIGQVGMRTELAQKIIQQFANDEKFWELTKKAAAAKAVAEQAMEKLENHRKKLAAKWIKISKGR